MVYKSLKEKKLENQLRCHKWNRSPVGRKWYAKRNWRRRGVKADDYEALYNWYKAEKECWVCGHNVSVYPKHLDHCHESGDVRCVCCSYCNLFIMSKKEQCVPPNPKGTCRPLKPLAS